MTNTKQRTYAARIIDRSHTGVLVAIYYKSLNLGTCDVDYVEIVGAESDELACREALLQYLS